MSERKYTDEEIEKALECCQSHTITDCRDCPNRASGDNCVNELMRNALDLIKHQKAEVDKLQEVNADLNESLRLAAEANKDLKAEIERLKADVRICESEIRCERIHRGMAKAEAIKEFAVRFKETTNGIVGLRDGVEIYETKMYQIRATSFDNLVAEMTEETK